MRVLLSGTSNSIIAGGISTVLARSPQVTAFQNASYGASGAIAIGDHLSRTDFAQHDVCIIDYCVNEEVFLSAGTTKLEDALSHILNMVDAASRGGCLPVLLILPTHQRLGRVRPLERALMEKLRPFGVPVFNTYDYIGSLTERYGVTTDDFFMDMNHVNRWLNKFIGEQILNFLSQLDFAALTLHDTGHWYRPLTFVPHDRIVCDGDNRVVTHETRLMTRQLLSLASGARLQIDHGAPCLLSGVTLNAARSWGKLCEDGRGTEVFRTEMPSLFSSKRGLTLVSMPICPVLQLETGSTRLIFDALALEGPDRPDLRLEIAGVIVTELHQDRPLAVLAPKGEAVRIDQKVSLADEAQIIHEAGQKSRTE